MTRVNFRAIEDRFTHIDGTIVRTDVSFRADGGPASVRVVLCFYPWWEHPLYLAAIDAGRDWGFADTEAGKIEVVIDAIAPVRCDVRAGYEAIDMAFHTEHPMLWEHENEATIICNTAFEPRTLLEGLLARRLPHVDRATLLRYLPPYAERSAPYALGGLPSTLFHLVRSELERMGVELFIAHAPTPTSPLVALDVDDNVLVIAEDFVVEVPEIEHRPEWFGAGGPRDRGS